MSSSDSGKTFLSFSEPPQIIFFQIKILYTMPSTSSSLSSLREPSPTHHIIETVPIDNEGIYLKKSFLKILLGKARSEAAIRERGTYNLVGS